jgi:bifunctional enzyme CysN/CysC
MEKPLEQVEQILSMQETMNIVFVGHVDHGKSTVIGRLLADTGTLPEGKLEQIRADCERNSKPFEYAYLIDALKDERAQSITIDSARVFFQSEKRHYIIIDAPGHIEFIKNMVTGASRAEAGVLVIDAHEGVRENSRRHGYLLWMLGIKQIVVAVNKMDRVNYDQNVYEAIQAEYSAYLQEIGVEPLCYIPVSGREGDNISILSERTPWYQGPTVLEALDRFEKAKALDDKPFRMPVQDIFKFSMFGDERRIVAGTISSGSVRTGDELVFYPSGKKSKLQRIETFHAPEKEQAASGEAIGFTLDEQIYIQRGQIAALSSQPAPEIAKRMRVSIFWLGAKPLETKKQYLLKIGTARVKAQVEIIHRVIDASNYSAQNQKHQIEHHDVAECTLLLNQPIAFDLSETLTDTSRFVLVDDYEIWGGGIVLEAISDRESALLDETILRENKWIKSNVSMVQRAEKYNQRSALILITGEKENGRKHLASTLERRLFEDGKIAYYLGIGSVLYGVNADLKRESPDDNWDEHLRRMAQIAHLFIDAGMLLIITAVELTGRDLKIFKSIMDTRMIETVWIGDRVTTDIAYDLQIPAGEDKEESVMRIKRLMQSHGLIFNP